MAVSDCQELTALQANFTGQPKNGIAFLACTTLEACPRRYNDLTQGGEGTAASSHEQPAGLGEGLRQAKRQLQGGFGAAARQLLLRPAALVRSGDASIGAVRRLAPLELGMRSFSVHNEDRVQGLSSGPCWQRVSTHLSWVLSFSPAPSGIRCLGVCFAHETR